MLDKMIYSDGTGKLVLKNLPKLKKISYIQKCDEICFDNAGDFDAIFIPKNFSLKCCEIKNMKKLCYVMIAGKCEKIVVSNVDSLENIIVSDLECEIVGVKNSGMIKIVPPDYWNDMDIKKMVCKI